MEVALQQQQQEEEGGRGKVGGDHRKNEIWQVRSRGCDCRLGSEGLRRLLKSGWVWYSKCGSDW